MHYAINYVTQDDTQSVTVGLTLDRNDNELGYITCSLC